MKLSIAIRGFFLDRSFDLAESTVEGYQYIYDHLVEFLENKDIESVGKYDILMLLKHLAGERKVFCY